jgi:hypothetical protein
MRHSTRPPRGGVLLSSGMESLSLDKDLVTDFTAW